MAHSQLCCVQMWWSRGNWKRGSHDFKAKALQSAGDRGHHFVHHSDHTLRKVSSCLVPSVCTSISDHKHQQETKPQSNTKAQTPRTANEKNNPTRNHKPIKIPTNHHAATANPTRTRLLQPRPKNHPTHYFFTFLKARTAHSTNKDIITARVLEHRVGVCVSLFQTQT